MEWSRTTADIIFNKENQSIGLPPAKATIESLQYSITTEDGGNIAVRFQVQCSKNSQPLLRAGMPPTQQGNPQTKGASLYFASSRLGSRKPRNFTRTAGLELDPNAHSRTDPVKALGTLLKLLTTLPSRIGGCQYKLTPTEHTLSLHLISILDPFVCHGARALTTSICDGPVSALSSFVDQPTEILDAILSHVDSRKDLLSIGLVCKRLCDIIFPRHFEYRVIRCKLSSISLWNHLIIHKSLSRNVRKLEILDERSSTPTNSHILTPAISQRDTDLENTDDELRVHSKQEKYLSEALLHMTGLEDFKWSCNHSPISIANVWPTLMIRASNMKTLEICDNLLFGPRFSSVESGDSSDSSDSDRDEADQPGTYFRGLETRLPPALLSTTNIVFRSTPHSFGAPKQPDLKRISRMLQKCPQLESLEITYIPPRVSGNPTGGQGTTSRVRPLADDFFTYSGWTSTLTTLILNNVRCSTSSAPLTFLSEHPALEVLHLDIGLHIGGFSGPSRLPHGSLPNLREIKSSKELINTILECPSDSPRPLQILKGFKLSGQSTTTSANPSRSVSDAVFLSNLKHLATLHRVELSGWQDMEDIRKLVPSIPNVQHLALGKRIGAIGGRRVPGGSSGPSTNITDWIDLLSTLPDLSTLHGVKFFYEVPSDSARSNDHSSAASTHALKSQFVVSQPMQMSMMERSRMRKNDEVAGVLAWKCAKLRWVDYWEDGSGKMIHLVRDHCGEEGKVKVRWEVKRLKCKC